MPGITNWIFLKKAGWGQMLAHPIRRSDSALTIPCEHPRCRLLVVALRARATWSMIGGRAHSLMVGKSRGFRQLSVQLLPHPRGTGADSTSWPGLRARQAA